MTASAVPAASGNAADQPAPPTTLDEFGPVREDLLRLGDLDFQMHVNNATFTTLLANARHDFLYYQVKSLLPAGSKLVIARLEVNFVDELRYAAPVSTGTRILTWGRTSVRVEQAIYQDKQCAARAISVFVYVSAETGKPAPWPDDLAGRVEAAVASRAVRA